MTFIQASIFHPRILLKRPTQRWTHRVGKRVIWIFISNRYRKKRLINKDRKDVHPIVDHQKEINIVIAVVVIVKVVVKVLLIDAVVIAQVAVEALEEDAPEAPRVEAQEEEAQEVEAQEVEAQEVEAQEVEAQEVKVPEVQEEEVQSIVETMDTNIGIGKCRYKSAE
jgi:hypothetical protein